MVIKLSVDNFGSVVDHVSGNEKQVKRFTWTNDEKKVSIQVKSAICFFVHLIKYFNVISWSRTVQ